MSAIVKNPYELEWGDLLRFGYLPEILPPVFSTHTFADFVEDRGSRSPVGGLGDNHRTRWASYDATKRSHQRRRFGLLHPEAFHDISLFITQHWREISSHFDKTRYSRSRPWSSSREQRAITIMSHSDLNVSLYRNLSEYSFIAKTDISRFYPTIYTHSIPWSMHGKNNAKKDTSSKSKTITFNRLDQLVRASQEGQSVGLPVGPDTSRIIAEIVATAVDCTFASRFKHSVPLIRHVDDVWIGARTFSEAEQRLQTYRECLREFELDINELKTAILPALEALEPAWPLALKQRIHDEFSGLSNEDQT